MESNIYYDMGTFYYWIFGSVEPCLLFSGFISMVIVDLTMSDLLTVCGSCFVSPCHY